MPARPRAAPAAGAAAAFLVLAALVPAVPALAQEASGAMTEATVEAEAETGSGGVSEATSEPVTGAAPAAAAGSAPAPLPPLPPLSPNGRSMTLDELEAYIADQKSALERARRDRKIARDEAERVAEELERRKAREAALRDEVRTLCGQRVPDADGSVGERNACEDDPAG